jgi:hypothetical protein
MNLAFDAKGRLWVSSTSLYPWPAKSDAEKTDAIKVIELNDDGSAKSVTTFADGLDIPIGLLPLGDGKRVLAYDIATGLLPRYEGLWSELTSTENFSTDEMWRIEKRIDRLNDLGFDVDELDIVTDWDGCTVRVQPPFCGSHRWSAYRSSSEYSTSSKPSSSMSTNRSPASRPRASAICVPSGSLIGESSHAPDSAESL